MNCPHCHSPLSSIEVSTSDGQIHAISECLNCGGHFLPSYVGNFLTIETARNIDSVLPKSRLVPSVSPVCPQCGQVMSGIKDDAVPETVTVFTCPNNHGDFYPKNQLLLFKEAQQAKIYYHKVWGIPLKSAFAIFIPIFIVFTAVTILPTIIKEVSTTQENRIKASEILTSPLITPISSSQVLISFSTKNPTKASIKFTEGLNKIFDTSPTPETNHLQSVDGLISGTLYKYVIILNTNGRIVTTSEYTFTAP